MGTTNLGELQARLWESADQLRANSKLKSSEYSIPVLGLIFLLYAGRQFDAARERIEGQQVRRRKIGPADYQAQGVPYIPDEAQFEHLLNLPEEEDLAKALNEAMRAVEAANPELDGVLPRSYAAIDNGTLVELLRVLSAIPDAVEGDALGLIYEYFLGKFAFAEGQKGGEFYTPTSIVRLIVEVIEPYHGKIFDPACGSGGMFVQSAKFVERHQREANEAISVYGQERIGETVRLARMNLAVHGLGGQIREANTYYEDPHKSRGGFDFVMANPPFNVDKVDKARLEGDKRFPYALPTADNANYLWIQIFASALNDQGRAGFVMANSASDARGSEQNIRRRILEDGLVDAIVAISPNFFFTVTLPCTLWFLDRGKSQTDRSDRVLFIDAREIYNRIDRAHRDFRPEQLEFIANIVRLYRGEPVETVLGSERLLEESFAAGTYADVPGLCKAATLEDIAANNWSLSPGRYVGLTSSEADPETAERFESLVADFERLSGEAESLAQDVAAQTTAFLDQLTR